MNNEPFPSNRRRLQRERVALTAVIWPVAEEPGGRPASPGQAGLRVSVVNNVSMNGLSFKSHTAYPLDSVVWIRIRVGTKTCQLKAVVQRSCTALVSGRRTYTCGVQFVRSHQTTHAQAIIAGYLETSRRKIRGNPAAGR